MKDIQHTNFEKNYSDKMSKEFLDESDPLLLKGIKDSKKAKVCGV